MEEAVSYALNRLNYVQIRENQMKVVAAYLQGKDVFFCSPTGSGKSLTFEVAPIVLSYMKDKESLPNVTCIVVSPLVSLMRTQEAKMNSMGLRCLYLSETSEEISGDNFTNIENGHYEILLCSPETVLGHYRKAVGVLAERKLLGAIFIDEAHCIRKL